jgi:predicted oxidoreductase
MGIIPSVQLAPQGPTLSQLVLGTMKWGQWGKQFTTDEYRNRIELGIELGYTTFDHADIYGSYTTEAEFGKALAQAPKLREKIQLLTKCGIRLISPNRPQHQIKSYDTSKEHILASVDRSLQNLQTDYIDLLLIHRPSPLMEPREIAAAFAHLKATGKVLHFGVSNFTPSQFELLAQEFPLVTNQVQAAINHLDPFLNGTFDQLQQHSIRPMVWSPLGAGKLFSSTPSPATQRILSTAQEIGNQIGESSVETLLIAWLLRHPAGLIPVLGTSSTDRMRILARATQIAFPREAWFKLWSASTGEEVP